MSDDDGSIPDNPFAQPPDKYAKRVGFDADERVVDAFDKVHESRSRQLRKAMYEDAYGQSESYLRKMQELEDARDEKKRKVRELQAEIENDEAELKKMRERYDQAREREMTEAENVENLVEIVESGTRLTHDFPLLERVARQKNVEPADVQDMVEERSTMELPDTAFRRRKGAEKPNWRKDLPVNDPRHKG